MAPHLSIIARETVVALRHSGKSMSEINRLTGISRKTISFWIRRMEQYGSLESHHRQVYERATTKEQDEAIIAAHMADPTLSTQETSALFNTSLDTIRRRLKEAGLKPKKIGKKSSSKTTSKGKDTKVTVLQPRQSPRTVGMWHMDEETNPTTLKISRSNHVRRIKNKMDSELGDDSEVYGCHPLEVVECVSVGTDDESNDHDELESDPVSHDVVTVNIEPDIQVLQDSMEYTHESDNPSDQSSEECQRRPSKTTKKQKRRFENEV